MKETLEERIVIGCNYHTKWQTDKAMRFVLLGIQLNRALLGTRKTHKRFWTNTEDLIFIRTQYNIDKADRLEKTKRNKEISL